jgi:hypothetical protein
VHAFVAPVLFGVSRLDAFDVDAEAQPPYRQPTQPEKCIARGEGCAVVGANGMGQAEFLESPFETGKSKARFG